MSTNNDTEYYVLVLKDTKNKSQFVNLESFGEKDVRRDLANPARQLNLPLFNKKPEFDPNIYDCLKIRANHKQVWQEPDFGKNASFQVVSPDFYNANKWNSKHKPVKVEVIAQVMADGKEFSKSDIQHAQSMIEERKRVETQRPQKKERTILRMAKIVAATISQPIINLKERNLGSENRTTLKR